MLSCHDEPAFIVALRDFSRDAAKIIARENNDLSFDGILMRETKKLEEALRRRYSRRALEKIIATLETELSHFTTIFLVLSVH